MRLYQRSLARLGFVILCTCALCLFLKVAEEQRTRDAEMQLQQLKTLPKDPLLLYRAENESMQFMLNNWNSKKLIRTLWRIVYFPRSTFVYPNITLQTYSFRTFNGEPLNTAEFVSQLLYKKRNSSHPITNVIHFYAMSRGSATYRLKFKGYLTFLAGLWVSNVDKIIIWYNRIPQGRYWQMFIRNVTLSSQQHRVIFANRSMPTEVFGIPLSDVHIEHSIDVMKLEAAILLGGFFLDNDAVVVKSLQAKRNHACVIGRQSPIDLTIGIFGCRPSSTFHILWYMQYQNYFPRDWSMLSVVLPAYLWEIFPNLCRVEEKSFAQPIDRNLLFANKEKLKQPWDWRKLNSIVHFYRNDNYSSNSENETSIMTKTSLFGEVSRFVMTGN